MTHLCEFLPHVALDLPASLTRRIALATQHFPLSLRLVLGGDERARLLAAHRLRGDLRALLRDFRQQ